MTVIVKGMLFLKLTCEVKEHPFQLPLEIVIANLILKPKLSKAILQNDTSLMAFLILAHQATVLAKVEDAS